MMNSGVVVVMPVSIWWRVTRWGGGASCLPSAGWHGLVYTPLLLACSSLYTHEGCVYVCLCSCVITAGSSLLRSLVTPQNLLAVRKCRSDSGSEHSTPTLTLPQLFLAGPPGVAECIECIPHPRWWSCNPITQVSQEQESVRSERERERKKWGGSDRGRHFIHAVWKDGGTQYGSLLVNRIYSSPSSQIKRGWNPSNGNRGQSRYRIRWGGQRHFLYARRSSVKTNQKIMQGCAKNTRTVLGQSCFEFIEGAYHSSMYN